MDKYVVIKRYGEHLGLFSYVITNLGNINKVIKQGKIPIIDMQTYPNSYLDNDEVGKINAWELYFEQPCNISLKDIENKEVEEITSVNRNRPNDSMAFFLNEKKRNYWQEVSKKYLRLDKKTEKYINNKEKEILGKNNRILGVLCRGTDYVKLKPFRHPVQPTVEEVIEKAKEVMQKQNCNKIFLATEDEDIFKSFQKEFGSKLIYNDQKRFKDTENKYLSEIHFDRKQDAYLKGLEYLTTIVLLSRCNCFVAGRTSGTIGVILFNPQFNYMYLFDKGRYKFPKLPSIYKQS